MIDEKYLTDVLRQLVKETYENIKPATIMLGRVATVDPITIKISDNLTLPASCIIVSDLYTIHEMKTTVADGHMHKVSLDLSLKAGDKVRLLRQSGGQLFYVLGVVK